MTEDESGSVRRRSLQGFRWTAVQTAVLALIGPLSQIIKARFLLPEELGAVAVLMIIYGLLHTLERSGLGQSIVQADELTCSGTFTYLVAAMAIGLMGSAAMFASAEVVQRLFAVPGSAQLIRLGSPLLFLTMLDQVARALLHRDLRFRGTSAIEMVKRAVNLTSLWVLLAAGQGALSVVLSMLLATAVSSVLLTALVLRGGAIRLAARVDRNVLRHLWSFGSRVGVKQLFTYFTHRADELIIGIALTPEALGVYHLAKETLDRLRSLITAAFSKVLLSLFARIKDDRARLSRVYERVLLMVSYVGAPVFIGIALTADLIVPVVFGEAWVAAVTPFRFLAIAMIPIVLTANLSTSLLYALGDARAALRIELVLNLPYLAALFLASRTGLLAVLLVYVLYCFIKGVVLQYASGRRLEKGVLLQLKTITRALLRVVPMVVAVIAVTFLLQGHVTPTTELVAVIAVGAAAYAGSVLLTDRGVLREFKLILHG